MEEKEKVFSILIKRKQSRYQRIPGTQLLKMNNPKEAAKIFLGTADGQSRQNKSVYGATFQKGGKESD